MASVKDPVSAEERAAVYARDGGCIAPLIDPSAGPCRNQWDKPVDRTDPKSRTLDHVPPRPGSPRVSNRRWMVQLCWGHHVNSGWATSHREDERRYLASKHGGS